MATVSRVVASTPSRVFDVLCNGWYYSNWVVGTSHMRAVDSAWPEVGAKLHHASGVWPLMTRDETEVVACTPPDHLRLIARGRPAGEARIDLVLEAEGGRTRVTMTETPASGPGRWLHNPVSDALLARRNLESLARLAAIAEDRTQPG